MISVSEARTIIQQNIPSVSTVEMKLQDAVGLRLSADIIAPVDIPAYPQSSMDGYAFSYDNWKDNLLLEVKGEMAAGNQTVFTVEPANAVRIFTGAAVPNGADTVVMQEKVHITNGRLTILDDQLLRGSNVRLQGSEVKAGELALAAGTILSPAALGFLAGMGITQVPVPCRPKVTIIITGNELQMPGEKLEYGQVYDANSYTLTAVLQQAGLTDIQIRKAPDVLELLTRQLQEAIQESDIILLTGGVSVGDYDFVLEAAQRCDITKQFHKLKQKPGKPLFFGTKAQKLVFGLPGNPSSVLTCFYMYVLPVISSMITGKTALPVQKVPLAGSFKKNTGLTHFLKGYYDGEEVSQLGAQESYRMRSFATANCLIEIPEDITVCEEGALVTIHLLPV